VPTLSLGVDPDSVIKEKKLGGCAQSIDELEEMTRKFLNNPDDREKIGSNARLFAREHYDIKVLLPKYLELFGGLIEK